MRPWSSPEALGCRTHGRVVAKPNFSLIFLQIFQQVNLNSHVLRNQGFDRPDILRSMRTDGEFRRSWCPFQGLQAAADGEFIPAVGYESMDVNSIECLVLTGLRAPEDGPLKLSRHTLGTWSLKTLSDLLQVLPHNLHTFLSDCFIHSLPPHSCRVSASAVTSPISNPKPYISTSTLFSSECFIYSIPHYFHTHFA